MQRASAPVAPSREGSLQALQDYVDKETAAAIQAATTPLLAEIERLARQVTHLQTSAAEALQMRTAERDRMQREMREYQRNHEAAMQTHKDQRAQTLRETEQRLAHEHEAAMKPLRAELEQECKARVQAEARLTATQESHAALTQAMKAMKPATVQTVTVPVKGKAVTWAFELRRRGDGLLDAVIAKPLA